MSLAVEGVTKNFGGVAALKTVDFMVPKGKVFAWIGPNGAGKTTLLNILSGWSTPDGGRVFVDNSSPRFLPEEFARLGVVRGFQSPRLFHSLTVLDNLLLATTAKSSESISTAIFGRIAAAAKEKTNIKLAEEALRIFGVHDVRRYRPNQLSGGQQKLVQLALLKLQHPKIILLDEPTVNIAQDRLSLVRSYIQEEKERGACIVLVEHNLALVKEVADFIGILVGGEVRGKGSVQSAEVWRLLDG